VTPAAPGATIGVVLKGYPRLSETFIAQELLELERAGFNLRILSLRHPTNKTTHPIHREIRAPVLYLPEYLLLEPLRVWRAWRTARRLPGYRAARRVFLRDLRRDPTPNRIRRFGQGLVIATEASPALAMLYAHFIHTPTSAARYAALMTGLPFAISAHAKDIWTTPAWELAEKLADCRWCVTCTRVGHAELVRHAGEAAHKVALVYHGIDIDRFPPAPARAPRRGDAPGAPVHILAVGRAVAKKGLDTLIRALALLPPDFHWRFTHIGGGPLKRQLADLARSLGLAERCHFVGALPQQDVRAAYQDADLFALPCRVDASGDRDGLPNVLIEASSQGLAVISTPVSGIPELVEDGVNGCLVPADQPQALADALLALGRDHERRERLGAAGQQRVHAQFSHRATIGALHERLAAVVGTTPRAAP
jgi:glycosyltransferase involved in cell wall biosynthesis